MQILQDKKNGLISQFVEPDVFSALDTLLSAADISDAVASSCKIAALFGSEREFSMLVCGGEADQSAAELKLISSFSNNLNLLVQKTWVEKSDVALKEQILLRLERMCGEIKNKSYITTYPAFIGIFYDVVSLMFGQQAKTADFSEYALRIDPLFGIFWWYLKNLPDTADWSAEKTRIILLVGMFFFANY